jgi:DhnA family fructose-bisphosphate aldolase class Ia
MLCYRPMSETGKAIRLNRIFPGAGKRALIVAYDHAMMLGPIPGTENPSVGLKAFVDGQVDGVLISPGTLQRCATTLLVPNPPAILLRIDWTNLWFRASASSSGAYRTRLVAAVEDAVRFGADAVLTYMFMGSGDPEMEADEVAKNGEVARECERLGMPHIMESMARGREVPDPSDPKWVRLHTRIASELGADLIKTDYTGDPESMRAIVKSCPTPLLLAGGPRKDNDESALELIRGAATAGAAGVIFGRNIFQSSDVGAFLARARTLLNETPKI